MKRFRGGSFLWAKNRCSVWSAIGKEFTLATNQVDFAVPSKFNLNYIDEDGESKTPLCIHRAPLGTHERFIGFLLNILEEFSSLACASAGCCFAAFDKFTDYAKLVVNSLKADGLRVKLNDRADKIGSR